MMRVIYFIIFSTILFACNQSETLESKKIIILKGYDTIGDLYGILPTEFDTMYNWTDKSDCGCCDKMKYRFHSKKFRIVKETGFFHSISLDTGLYFTIEHSPHASCDENIAMSQKYSNFTHKHKDINPNFTFTSDTGRIYNGIKYYIFKYIEPVFNPSTNKLTNFNHVEALTKVKNRNISFHFQSNVTRPDSLNRLAENILKTLDIK